MTLTVALIICVFVILVVAIVRGNQTRENLISSVRDISIKNNDNIHTALPRGGRLYPIVASPEGCTVPLMNPFARGYYKYGCPSGECCKKSCCQVMPAKCTAGGGSFGSRYGNEGPPVTGPIMMTKMGNNKTTLSTCDLCPTPYACPGCHMDL